MRYRTGTSGADQGGGAKKNEFTSAIKRGGAEMMGSGKNDTSGGRKKVEALRPRGTAAATVLSAFPASTRVDRPYTSLLSMFYRIRDWLERTVLCRMIGRSLRWSLDSKLRNQVRN
jgi:hypothetical protein